MLRNVRQGHWQGVDEDVMQVDSIPSKQETLDYNPMLLYCWAIVCDSVPTVQQQWVNVSCLLACAMLA